MCVYTWLQEATGVCQSLNNSLIIVLMIFIVEAIALSCESSFNNERIASFFHSLCLGMILKQAFTDRNLTRHLFLL